MNPQTLHKISYGLYIVSSGTEDKCNGQIANTVFQVTSDPPQIAVCINKQNYTHEFITRNRVFTVSILTEEAPMTHIGLFGFKSGRDIDKFKGINYKVGKTGSLIPTNYSAGYLEVELRATMDVGSHTLFMGEVVEAELLGEGEPMTYSYYHRVKRGKAPKSAPTYIEEPVADKAVAQEEASPRYRCTVCGYIYDPKEGDPTANIPPGTSFEKLPSDWVCPICGVSKDKFEKVED
ncbi:rubredoxin [bacterium]|nr:rubredoxin [bacterium]